ncbi:MAG: diaminopimelate epimerase [Janthinobacterium lividum]
MRVPFTKMHGCGNDFVVLDERAHPLDLTPAQAAALCDRRLGIGCDQLVTLTPVAGDAAAVFMRIRNPDGSEAGACGNATRCVASLVAAETGLDSVTVHTVSGILASERLPDGRVRVDMGAPRLGWRDVPLAREVDTLHLPLPGNPSALSMGNPHATFFLPDVDAVATHGAALERAPLFPERANIGFAHVLAPDRIRLRVWERGAGLTLACGSGACAALVNAARRGLCGRRAEVLMDGGTLEIEWRDDDRVWMTGPVATSFTGEIDLASFGMGMQGPLVLAGSGQSPALLAVAAS